MAHELNASIQAAIPDEAAKGKRELTKTRKITSTARLELTQDEIAAYVIAGVKRDHKDVKDYELAVVFHAHTHDPCPPISAVVSGERIG